MSQHPPGGWDVWHLRSTLMVTTVTDSVFLLNPRNVDPTTGEWQAWWVPGMVSYEQHMPRPILDPVPSCHSMSGIGQTGCLELLPIQASGISWLMRSRRKIDYVFHNCGLKICFSNVSFFGCSLTMSLIPLCYPRSSISFNAPLGFKSFAGPSPPTFNEETSSTNCPHAPLMSCPFSCRTVQLIP